MSEEEIKDTPEIEAPTDSESMIDFIMGGEGSLETEEAATTDDPEVSNETTTTDTFEAQVPEEEEDSEESEDEEEESSDDAEDTETEEGEDEGEDSDEEQPEPEVVFEINGESITADELKAGYLRQSDYTAKTQELAEVREGIKTHAEGLKAYEESLAKNLALSLQVLEPQLADLANTDWDTLLQTDAYEYQQKKGELELAQQRYHNLQAAADQQLAARQQQAQAAREQKRTVEQQQLFLALPDLADSKKGRDLAHGIKEYAINTVGLTEQEAGSMIDHRLIVTLNKARLYDELQNAGLSVADKKRAKGPKQVISGGKPQSKANKSARKTQSAQERLRQTGSADALIDLISSG